MKKVFYILNLLFLTLFVFGGSVFAAGNPPTQYIDENGIVQTIPGTAVDLSKVQANGLSTNYPLTGDSWYYINGSFTKNDHFLYVASGENVNIVVNATPKATLSTYGILVPNNASLNFWAASNNGTDNGVSLEINNNNSAFQKFVIGNNDTYKDTFKYDSGNFGDITFNSGSYTVINNKNTIPYGPAIGSDTNSGGTITVNQEAEVTAYSQGQGTTSTGVVAAEKSCNIEVNGGTLRALYGATYNIGQVINVGEKGSLTLDNQGYIVSGVGLTEQSNWNLESGIVAVGPQLTANAKYNWGAESPWDAYVYGEVSIPTPQGVKLEAPVNATSGNAGYYGSLTIAEGVQFPGRYSERDGIRNRILS